MSDLLLEFTSKQIRHYYGWYSLPFDNHAELIARYINVAAWLTDDFCLVPVGFTLECGLLRRVLERKADFLIASRVIELPLRGGFEDFVERRRDAYFPHREHYKDLYDDDKVAFALKFAPAFRDRRQDTAPSLVSRWSAGPDRSPLWLPIKEQAPRSVSRLSKIAGLIHKNEAGIVWQAIEDRLKASDHAFDDDLQRILQSEFIEGYCQEYGTDTLFDLQHGWRSLRSGSPVNQALSYRNFVESLEPLGIHTLIEELAAESMIQLRRKSGYLEFIQQYRLLAQDRPSLKRWAAAFRGAEGPKTVGLLSAAYGSPRRNGDRVLPTNVVEQIDELLASAAVFMALPEFAGAPGPKTIRSGSTRETTLSKKRIGIFVALAEEREVFERSSLQLKREGETLLVGEKDGVRIEVFCAFGMGRVAAAVRTMEYLHEHQPPELIIVAGLAGGFADAGVAEGAVIVPKQIFDLALRKVKDDVSDEFRLEAYEPDRRLIRYLESNIFDEVAWATRAHEVAEWPKPLRPNIRYEPLTSVDEVISSVEYAKELMSNYPKLIGVEMEAGGVFAAARTFDGNVSVIRAVSDKANPAKADNEWRKRSMKTIICLLEAVDLSKMLQMQKN